MKQTIKETLAGVLDSMDIAYEGITVEEVDENHYRADIQSEEYSPLLIGWHGETIGAMQYILKTILWRKLGKDLPDNFFVSVDVDDYRMRQEFAVKQMVERKAEEVLESQRSAHLQPMGSYFRRIAHTHLASLGHKELTSESEGEGESRHLVIVYKG